MIYDRINYFHTKISFFFLFTLVLMIGMMICIYFCFSGGKEHCKTPDSPEGARAVAPRSPISPKIHHSSLVPPRTNRNGSISPIINGHSDDITPPPTATPISSSILTQPILSQDPARALIKIKRFLGALVQFAQDTCHDNGDKVRALVLSLASGGLTSEEFKIALQDATNFPVRPNVLPFLRIHIPLLQREIASLARNNNQVCINKNQK